jgi:hypothetical protein
METGDMAVTNAPKYHDSTNYRIKLNGRLDRKWSDWFDQMEISTEGDQTILTGDRCGCRSSRFARVVDPHT